MPKRIIPNTLDGDDFSEGIWRPPSTIRCAICDESILKGLQYFHADITTAAASKLLDVDKPELAPAWQQQPDGKVHLNFCTTCAGELVDVSMLTGAIA